MKAARPIAGLAIATIALTGSAAGAKSHHKAACNRHLVARVLVTHALLVWGKRKHTSFGPATTYFACARPGGKRLELGVNGPDLGYYGPKQTIGDFTAAGNFAAAHASSGEPASTMCFKYNPTGPCPFPSYWLVVADIKSRREVNIRQAVDPNGAIALSPNGAIAWLAVGGTTSDLWATPLHPDGKSFSTSPAKLDSGAIDPGSLKFSGTTLFWTNSGSQHQQVIQ